MKGVFRKFQECFKEVSRVFHESVKDISRVFHNFQGCFQSVSRKFQENFQGVSKKVLCCMALIAASQAEEGLVGFCIVELLASSNPLI